MTGSSMHVGWPRSWVFLNDSFVITRRAGILAFPALSLENLSVTGPPMSKSSWLSSTLCQLSVVPKFVYEGIVLHDQDRKQKPENYMAMKYQKGTVYPSGKKVKMWYGKYLLYGQDSSGKEVRRHRNVSICPKAGNPKWKAEQLLREMILKECGILAEMPSVQQ